MAGLIANPGPDGISLREALAATNNDPGSYAIGFARALAGMTIAIEASPLPPLKGGGVTIEGDIDGNGKPDLTLRGPGSQSLGGSGFQISSSGNQLHALTLERFFVGVLLLPLNKPLPNHRTFANNVVSSLVIRNVADGIRGPTFYSLECGTTAKKAPCPTYSRWVKTTVTGNTIEARESGVHVSLFDAIGDQVEGLSVTDNTIRLGTRAMPGVGGSAIQVDEGGNSTENRISDIVIARNSIDGVNGDGGIFVAAGLQRSQANTIDGIRILDNRVHLIRKGSAACCFAIVVEAGQDTWAVDMRPVNYPDRNIVRNVQVAGNSVSGSLAAGVKIGAGIDAGGSHNRIENVRVERNVIRSSILGKGVYLWVGQISGFFNGKKIPLYRGTPATGNRITGVTIDANRITTGNSRPVVDTDYQTAGGIVHLGGLNHSRRGVIRDVRIRKNRIATAHVGIRLIGGLGATARGNSVTCVRLAGNRITGTRRAVSVVPNGMWKKFGRASGNRASLGGC